MQCYNFQPNNANPGKVAVQVTHISGVTNPQMPGLSQLYYSGAPYPIQSVPKQQMETEYGSFAFSNAFDATQPLSLCVSDVLTVLSLVWSFVPYSSSAQGVSYRGGSVIYNKTNFDKVTYNGVTYDVVNEDC
jgi:hypothetical protein